MFITQSKRAAVFYVVASDTFDSLCVRDLTTKKYKLENSPFTRRAIDATVNILISMNMCESQYDHM